MYKYSYISGPFSTYAEAQGALATAVSLIQFSAKKIVIANYADFKGNIIHELDGTLMQALRMNYSNDPNLRKKNKGFFICLKEASKQPASYFENLISEFYDNSGGFYPGGLPDKGKHYSDRVK